MTGRHLLIIAHGSRRQASNEEVRQLAARVGALRGEAFESVEAAFLELAEPSIPQGLAHCAEQGAREIVVFPYFLAAGTHVAQDIPDAIAEFRQGHLAIVIRLTPHLGALPQMAGMVLDMAA